MTGPFLLQQEFPIAGNLVSWQSAMDSAERGWQCGQWESLAGGFIGNQTRVTKGNLNV